MRLSAKNKRKIYYSTWTGEETFSKDEYGNETGEATPVYEEPKSRRLYVGPPSGESAKQAFGSIPEYSIVLIDSLNSPIAEFDHLWVYQSDTEEHYDFEVVASAMSLNHVTFAAKEYKG